MRFSKFAHFKKTSISLQQLKKRSLRFRQDGAALVVVMVLLVLMLGVILAFFSQSILQRQISRSSASQTAAELLAQGAINTIIGDFKQEIIDGSIEQDVPNTSPTVKLYRPSSTKYAMPGLAVPNLTSNNIIGSGSENLLKISNHVLGFYGENGGGIARAVNSSTAEESLNGRSMSLERWNKPRLMAGSGPDGLTPNKFTAPDWILVSRDGKNPKAEKKWSPMTDGGQSDVVIGRYAYVIYNEGGLLDANVAGYSAAVKDTSPTDASLIKDQTVYKGALSYADLTQVPGLNPSLVDQLVNWRNSATVSDGGSNAATNFFNMVAHNPNGFLSTAGVSAVNGKTDRMFVGRQQLIDFFKNKLGGGKDLLGSLQYLGNFSRTLNQPAVFPVFDGKGDNPNRPVVKSGPSIGNVTQYKGGNSGFNLDSKINPIFRNIRAQTAFERNDGSKAKIGEPLVKQRFALERLCWITYKGPSGDKLDASDALYKEYIRNGVSENLLRQGTAENIRKYFGLNWNSGGYWTYDVHGSGVISLLEDVANANREPDFFEMLKAGMAVGSIARARTDGGQTQEGSEVCTWEAKRDSRVDFQVLQIGANIIDAASPDSFATNIIFKDDAGVYWPFWGRVNLPYFMALTNVAILQEAAVPPPPANGDPEKGVVLSNPGKGAAFSVPTIWNPFQQRTVELNSDLVPSELRICIARFPLDQAQVSSVSFSNFNYAAGPHWTNQTGVTDPNSVPPNQKYPDYETPAMVQAPWSWTGTAYDVQHTGKLLYPATYAASIKFANNQSMFREPTPLWRKEAPGGPVLTVENNSLFTASGIKEPDGEKFVGFFLKSYPIRVSQQASKPGDPVTVYTMNQMRLSTNGYGLQISLEYKDKVNGAWVPYDQVSIRGNFAYYGIPYDFDKNSSQFYNRPALKSWNSSNRYGNSVNNITFDPRCASRWTTPKDYPLGTFLDSNQTTVQSVRPTSAMDGMNRNYIVGASSTNNSGAGSYADPDSTIRRAMGAYASGNFGFPMATPAQVNSRPIVLNRPFRSVAELGAVFSDIPWRNLDFSTPESGSSALLDVFCISNYNQSDPLIAGKVDLNTRQSVVIQSILSRAYRDEFGDGGGPLMTEGSGGEADTLAKALVRRTTSSDTNKGPLVNISDLVGRYIPNYTNPQSKQKYDGFSGDIAPTGSSSQNDTIQRFREASIRALSGSGMAGTWNVLVDIIAQSGRYPSDSLGLKGFLVEGERRLWVHLAIDRQTGQIIDQQIEQVTE